MKLFIAAAVAASTLVVAGAADARPWHHHWHHHWFHHHHWHHGY